MKKIFFVAALLCASMMSFAIDWSSYEWLGDGAGGGAYNNKYKVAPATGQEVVNIQQPGFAAEPGIYTNFPVAIDDATKAECSLPDGKYAIQGAGIVMYLSAFTAKETEVVIKDNIGTVYTFTVFYADGTATGLDQVQSDKVQSTKVIENGQLVIMNNGTKYNVQGQEMK